MEGDADLIKIDLVVAVISTHALTWRATPRRSQEDRFCNYFYPRPHMEGDTLAYFTPDEARISTHALTWRATTSLDEVARQMGIFLPTPSHGGRHCTDHTSSIREGFLPTPSHGGRRSAARRWIQLSNFYPRPHMEGDAQKSTANQSSRDFYPRPHMEGDKSIVISTSGSSISTHALTWRATMTYRRNFFTDIISTHALTWRATLVTIVMRS